MRYAYAVLLLALVCLPVSTPVHADDEKAEALVTRLFNVGALTQGRPDFIGEVSADVTNTDEASPLFGVEGTEPIFPFGQIDELIELIKASVNPESWESTLGADISSIGERTLVVRTYKDVVDEVAAYLGRLERTKARRVTVEIETYRLTHAQARGALVEGSSLLLDPARLDALRAAAPTGPSVALTTFERNRSSIFAGSQSAYVSDYDVEVAKESTISDPIVAVGHHGLSVDLRSILSPDGRSVLLTLSLILSRLEKMRTVESGTGRFLEFPEQDIARLLSKIEVPAGAWALIDGQSADGSDAHWMFAVRATPEPVDGRTDTARGIALESPAARPSRRFEMRTFDIATLQHAVHSDLGRRINLVPSNFTPPEPPELPEPTPIFAADTLVELLRGSIMPASWELKGAWIETRMDSLIVRNSPVVLNAIESQLQTLRREFLWSLAVTGEVVEVYDGLARELTAGPGRVVDPAKAALLESALEKGEARRLGEVRVTSMAGARNAMRSGRKHTYLSDFEVELAEGANIANPVIQSILSGAQLDVAPSLTTGGRACQVVLRFDRTRVRTPLRKVMTPHGELDAPVLDVLRLRSVLDVPLDKTVVVASAGSGGRRRLLLLEARLRRATD